MHFPRKITARSCKFSQRDNFSKRFDTVTHLKQIRIFESNWGTLEVKKHQKLSISLNETPQKVNTCTEK